ncbi:hypothetical protein [Sporolactobacillus sp. THM19-2]|uniref:hypothetical protein n=1 Tax=Sporolactobacillus sp. THM19-2 TaxID=2511171 RepID=UPI00101F1564|nr:hypothetical protein [Sporolactobacillus sp. THM19-2]RYL86048.1 hypothetical protein EWH91_14320 [Sporolactobacillus sp. THM19-2]
MRQQQKTEHEADHRGRIDIKVKSEYFLARSTAFGESMAESGTSMMEFVLSRNSPNKAYLRVKRNKGVVEIDGMTVEELLPYLKEHREELLVLLRRVC